ncbi:GNAT family N-acetyltransferase [Stenotrophomonas chelatiphaga]|uniref:GNAT family N-acetyltransferase n=1 Tax=Stenotrophomonas chelatiphaga TaxID=517011 RepID=UPI0028A0FE36|nr:GNAT family N-acetyltransferase [Stenotrophomonas chelatiphaga]
MSLDALPHFRGGRPEDAPALWELRTRCVRELCRSHYPPEVITRWAASPPPPRYPGLIAEGGCVVADDAHGRLLGYGILVLQDNEVDALFVAPEQAGKGLGQAVLERLLALADPRRDVLLSASLNAVAFYQRAGFLDEGEQAYPHPSGITLAARRMRRPAASALR